MEKHRMSNNTWGEWLDANGIQHSLSDGYIFFSSEEVFFFSKEHKKA
jgi:hypothetical protein